MIHASCVAIDGRAALIMGPSGSGKSGLALQLIALGATLVSDDQTLLHRVEDHLLAEAPATIAGQIEARGIGILAAPTIARVPVSVVVDMEVQETQRLPPGYVRDILGCPINVIRKTDAPHFPAAIKLYLQGKRLA